MIKERRVLECSSKGDIRFSALFAKIDLFGAYRTIEEHYQLSKRIGKFVPRHVKDVKGKIPTHIHIMGIDYDAKWTLAWYEILWIIYLDNHPELV